MKTGTCVCPKGFIGENCTTDSRCNFDNDTNCIWHNVHVGDNFDWTLHQGETPSKNTGPTYDHTTGTHQGKYYYIETSAPRQSNETAWLQSEYLSSSNGETQCLEFWYYMFGTSIGYLNVRLSENATMPGYNIWSMEGNQGPKWKFAQVTVTTDGLHRIIFEGTVGNGYEGDIALDDISFKQGNCSIAPMITSVAPGIVTSTVPTSTMQVLIGKGCYGDPCVRGVCYVHLDEYFCLCPSGFNGINCEIDTDECRSSPCKNGAPCEDGVDKFICHCPDGYTGHLCDRYMDPCSSNPCVRGKCFSHLQLHICICPQGYSGQFCERHVDHCANHPCENNGRCRNVNSSYTCECPFGFSGQDCSKEHGTKCFACNGSKLDSICNTVNTCNSDESCYVDTFLDGDGSVRYHAGCRPSSNCMPSTGDNCTYCCDTDYCNDNGCGLTGYHPASQRGPICFDCDDMTDMAFCKQITQCAPDEMCTVYGSPSMNYDSKCISKNNQCDAQGGNGFCQFCCFHDMCNQNCTKHLKHPCKGVTFFGHAVCIADQQMKYGTCVCPKGFNGENCSTDSRCNFDNDTNCIWHNVHVGDNFDWTLHQGETPSENTGPTYDHTTGTHQGKYYYIETSAPRQSNETAWLQSEYLSSSNGETQCLEFWYYMFGTSIGYLNVRLSENATMPGYNIWSKEGNQGPKWKFAQVTVTTDGLHRIIFEGTVGNGYEGDIALDDISFKQGNCSLAHMITSVASGIVTSTVPTTTMQVLLGQGCYGDPCV
ncbi:MAM and LDL-receptor class A domain-containing protein 1-like [Dreissena polymorpha]|uniref:MAM and LDL-receptor class A domain-containing protein 1-like n=1 Tax=Dreissena polymorpha TaxID=45954 RepID=UPI0022648135|nr:MAM and LDL-receptor class A domain-containing protein 1-like [Dreissena polymorpha]